MPFLYATIKVKRTQLNIETQGISDRSWHPNKRDPLPGYLVDTIFPYILSIGIDATWKIYAFEAQLLKIEENLGNLYNIVIFFPRMPFCALHWIAVDSDHTFLYRCALPQSSAMQSPNRPNPFRLAYSRSNHASLKTNWQRLWIKWDFWIYESLIYDWLRNCGRLGSTRTSCHGTYLAIALPIKIRSVPYTRP